MVGVGIDDEHRLLRVLLRPFAGIEHHCLSLALCLFDVIHGKAVIAVFIGHQQIVFNMDNFRIVVLFLEGVDLFLREGAFAGALMTAQKDEFLHGYSLVLVPPLLSGELFIFMRPFPQSGFG